MPRRRHPSFRLQYARLHGEWADEDAAQVHSRFRSCTQDCSDYATCGSMCPGGALFASFLSCFGSCAAAAIATCCCQLPHCCAAACQRCRLSEEERDAIRRDREISRMLRLERRERERKSQTPNILIVSQPTTLSSELFQMIAKHPQMAGEVTQTAHVTSLPLSFEGTTAQHLPLHLVAPVTATTPTPVEKDPNGALEDVEEQEAAGAEVAAATSVNTSTNWKIAASVVEAPRELVVLVDLGQLAAAGVVHGYRGVQQWAAQQLRMISGVVNLHRECTSLVVVTVNGAQLHDAIDDGGSAFNEHDLLAWRPRPDTRAIRELLKGLERTERRHCARPTARQLERARVTECALVAEHLDQLYGNVNGMDVEEEQEEEEGEVVDNGDGAGPSLALGKVSRVMTLQQTVKRKRDERDERAREEFLALIERRRAKKTKKGKEKESGRMEEQVLLSEVVRAYRNHTLNTYLLQCIRCMSWAQRSPALALYSANLKVPFEGGCPQAQLDDEFVPLLISTVRDDILRSNLRDFGLTDDDDS